MTRHVAVRSAGPSQPGCLGYIHVRVLNVKGWLKQALRLKDEWMKPARVRLCGAPPIHQSPLRAHRSVHHLVPVVHVHKANKSLSDMLCSPSAPCAASLRPSRSAASLLKFSTDSEERGITEQACDSLRDDLCARAQTHSVVS